MGRSPDAIVVGGGFAGLAAATLLAEQGAAVLLLESRPYLGGRARSWTDPETGSVVDNGQHLFVGCYRETLRFLRRIGSIERLAFQQRLSIPFLDPGGRLSIFSLPRRPLFSWSVVAGLLRFPGMTPLSRAGLLRIALDVWRKGRAVRPDELKHLDGQSVTAWLAAHGQGREALERLWHPLAIATLNEDPENASAAMLVPVLRDMLLGGEEGSRLGVPAVGLSDLYADPAAHFLRVRGSEIRVRSQVKQVAIEGGRCRGVVLLDGARLEAQHVIAAVPPAELLALLPEAAASDPFFAGCGSLATSPIVSIYLWFGNPVTDLPFAGLIGGEWQWLFNRHAFTGKSGPGHGITLVRSAARAFVESSREMLIQKALDDLRRFLPSARSAVLRHALVIKEKRAAMSPARGSMALRPGWRTPFTGLHLAGDWTATGLPATIEGAVISGHACAGQVLGHDRPRANLPA